MGMYLVKCEVKLNDETLPIMESIYAEDFEDAVGKVVTKLVDKMGVSPFDINNFEIGDI